MSNYLLDTDFLANLDRQRNKTTYAKIILLTWEEEPVYEIQGKITQGSVNIDGTSAVRRTCSLTMVAPDVDMTNTYWALKNKFKLEVGVENTIDSRYPDVCWFKQGMFCFTSLSMSHQSNNFTITLQGKDKCCLLNGELGGMITASTDFGQLEEQEILDNGEYMYTLTDIPIKTIIRSAVHFYGGEPMENIIINDVDDYGLELLEYRVENNDLYMLRNAETGEVTNLIIDGDKPYYLADGTKITLKEIGTTLDSEGNLLYHYYDQTEIANNNGEATIVYPEGNTTIPYQVLHIKQYDTAGYRRTDLTYAGELTANVGESLTSLLDKIKNMFSSFEYFYDVDGRFIFQKKKTYQNESWNNLVTQDSDTYANDAAYDTSAAIYTFENSQLLTAFSNQPNILNFKNDYSIWGKRTSASGTELPIHLRQAIEFKPRYYVSERREKKSYNNDTYHFPRRLFVANDYTITEYDKKQNTILQQLLEKGDAIYTVDWREIIYQMALDYYSLDEWMDNNVYEPTNTQMTFAELLIQNNPGTCPKGRTGYEIFYTD